MHNVRLKRPQKVGPWEAALVFGLLVLLSLSVVYPAFATIYTTTLKPGDMATWSLQHFDNASQISMDVLAVNGSMVTASLTLVPETGGQVVKTVIFDVSGQAQVTPAENVVLKVVNDTNDMTALSVSSSGLFNTTAVESLNKSDIAVGGAYFTLQKNEYELQTNVYQNGLATGQQSVYSVTVTLLQTACSREGSQNGCNTVVLGTQSGELSNAVGSQTTLSMLSSTGLGVYAFGISIPPLVIAASLKVGDQITPTAMVSVAQSNGVVLGAYRQLVTADVGSPSLSESFTWDDNTGVLVAYAESGSTHKQMQLVSTNLWSPTPNNVNVVLAGIASTIASATVGSLSIFTWSGAGAYFYLYIGLDVRDRLKLPGKKIENVEAQVGVALLISVALVLFYLVYFGVL
jgi:hypothetical protein